MGCFKTKTEFKINFWNFCLFLAYFKQKVAKKLVFCNFLKNGNFWAKFNITNVFLVKFPLLFFTLMNSFKSYVQYKIRQK